MNIPLSREVRAFASGSTVTLDRLADLGDTITRAAHGRGHTSEMIDLEQVELLYQLAKHLKQIAGIKRAGLSRVNAPIDDDYVNPMVDPRL